jgi:hypothetical protein
MGAQTAALFADVPLAKRVNHYIEWSGCGILLDMASALLSILTVITYMVCCSCSSACRQQPSTAVPAPQVQTLTRVEQRALNNSNLLMVLLQVETHYSEYDPVWMSLRVVDQACSVIFAAEWCFWLWLSRDRIGYVVAQHLAHEVMPC